MEIVYSIFIGMIVGKNASKIDGIVLQCRRDERSEALFVMDCLRDNDILYILMLDIFLFWLNWK